jgi:hypothetical protein
LAPISPHEVRTFVRFLWYLVGTDPDFPEKRLLVFDFLATLSPMEGDRLVEVFERGCPGPTL